ncbi:hypothetical protein SCLCIDRAFT_31631 [Scleroderma citrinum Foug A]|uniref:Uncharacterized protein n=1 Tax=Scleroderma citrinum Foug A TaxID=1036808 RepID=A0A0C2YVV1_9AGAM|nr:hypothetical protein SCLCIDRAFT_31631 [Scleroderma citrinum Foug A]
MVNMIHNKLSILRDAKEPVLVKDESIDCKINLETEDNSKDGDILKFEPPIRHHLLHLLVMGLYHCPSTN